MRRGLNLTGGEWTVGQPVWAKPTAVRYYLSKGMTVFRICALWETLQPTTRGALDEGAMAGLDGLVTQITLAGAWAVIDLHNYGRRAGKIIGESPDMTADDLADVWRRLAARYRSRPGVVFGLMNEPHDQAMSALVSTLNRSIAAIRETGAENLILCPGNSWCSGLAWISSGNGAAMLGIVDPGINTAFDVHQYLDDGSGQHPTCVPGSGSTRLADVTKWARTSGWKLFLGEFGGGREPGDLAEQAALLAYVRAADDVWLGWAYFASAGGWGKDNWSALDPQEGRDQPQMGVLING